MDVVTIFKGLPPEIATFLIAMIPIAELRGAIPVALTVYQLPILTTFLLSVIGNMLPAAALIWLLGPVSGYLMSHNRFVAKFFNWLFERTRHKFIGKYEKWGELALVLFVAVPLPATGAWTGAVAAFLFGIPKKRAVVLITAGVAVAGLIVSAMTLGLIKFF